MSQPTQVGASQKGETLMQFRGGDNPAVSFGRPDQRSEVAARVSVAIHLSKSSGRPPSDHLKEVAVLPLFRVEWRDDKKVGDLDCRVILVRLPGYSIEVYLAFDKSKSGWLVVKTYGETTGLPKGEWFNFGESGMTLQEVAPELLGHLLVYTS